MDDNEIKETPEKPEPYKLTLYKFLPLGIVLGLFAAYVFSNIYFVNCDFGAECKPIESKNISAVASAIKEKANAHANANSTKQAKADPAADSNSEAGGNSAWKNSNPAEIAGYCFENVADTNTNGGESNLKTVAETNARRVKPDKVDDLNCTASVLAEKKLEFDEKDRAVKSQQKLIDEIDRKLTENREAQVKKAGETNTVTNSTGATTATADAASDSTVANGKAPDAETNVTTLESGENTMLTQKNARVKLRDEAANKRQAAASEIGIIRGQIADRYSKRLVFMFMTAAFILLCLIAIIYSVYVIEETFKSEIFDSNEVGKKKIRLMRIWLIATFIAAIILAVFAWRSQEKHLSIVLPMFNQSIFANGDISFYWINIFNCIGFAAIIMVVGAAGAIFFKVVSLSETDAKQIERSPAATNIDVKTDANKETEEIESGDAKPEETKNQANVKDTQDSPSEKTASETANAPKADAVTSGTATPTETAQAQSDALDAELKAKYEPYRRNIKYILYLGAAMLFVGIVRLKLLADWHLLFVSKDYSELLTKFFGNSISVQAAFYTILLAVVFLPVALAIQSATATATATTKNWLEQLGLPVTTENVTKFLAVFSPLLATPIVDFLKHVFGISV